MTLLKEIAKIGTKALLGRGSFMSYSQFGEDALARSFLRASRGTYVDVGAYHPVLYSNTYAFYRRGWSGLVIEPDASKRALFSIMRSRDRFVASGIGTEAASAPYYGYEDGAYNTFDPVRVEELARTKGMHPSSTTALPIEPLGTLLKTHGISSIDLLSIDVEGMDLMVLESHDWSIRPKLIIVEAHGFDPAEPESHPIYGCITEHGYRLCGLAGVSLLFLRD